tara:strand:+ start:1669 stop:1974 length:306 start_codon:yes stop_codon:yes gene_type:complete
MYQGGEKALQAICEGFDSPSLHQHVDDIHGRLEDIDLLKYELYNESRNLIELLEKVAEDYFNQKVTIWGWCDKSPTKTHVYEFDDVCQDYCLVCKEPREQK